MDVSILWTKFSLLYQLIPWLNSTVHAFAPRALRGFAFRLHCRGSTLRLRSGTAPQQRALRAPPIPRRSPGKIHPWIFPGLQNRYAILHVAKSPSMAWYCLARIDKNPSVARYCLARKRNPSMDFLNVCRIAAQLCMLLSRPPWLYIVCQEREYLHCLLE